MTRRLRMAPSTAVISTLSGKPLTFPRLAVMIWACGVVGASAAAVKDVEGPAIKIQGISHRFGPTGASVNCPMDKLREGEYLRFWWEMKVRQTGAEDRGRGRGWTHRGV
ncbi:hypothetical protein BKA70DRAFT_1327003 [Coprinopsis sp. MPI-PUGE-AT-0042]|nr:hypothetical protein BKA70DRAFT_1327003 [Coprinopsis sp. MPI-PUGE-AT-0042]